MNFQLFDKVREMYPECTSKVFPIKGDMLEERLGISEEDEKMLTEEVSIIFHSAATVKFDEPLR